MTELEAVSMDYTRDPSLALSEKWRRYKAEKGKRGGKSGYYLDRFVPWYFFSVLFGAYAWYALAAVPAHHFRDPFWYAVNEMFGLYVELQLLINWLLIHNTDSSYQPAAEQSASLLLEDNVSSYNADQSCGGLTANGDQQVGSGTNTSLSNFSSSTCESLPLVTKTNGALEIANAPNDCYSGDYKTGLSYQMRVATAISQSGEVERSAFPYWSWAPCLWCGRLRPPRCHHCTLCKRCVLKRDHHCYFTRVCIGVNNQRHFLIFLFWSIVMTSLASCELIPYVLDRVFAVYSLWNFIFPINVVSTLSGQLPILYLHLIFMVWSLIFLFFVSLGMFSFHLFCALRGLTKFEYDNRIKIVNTQPMFARLRAVMGKNWGLAVLFPGYINGPLLEDGIKWPRIKP